MKYEDEDWGDRYLRRMIVGMMIAAGITFFLLIATILATVIKAII
jgi:hypothetical protein